MPSAGPHFRDPACYPQGVQQYQGKNMRTFMAVMAVAALLAGFSGAAGAGDKHLFYVNGCCINNVGEEGYEAIVKKLRGDGLDVIFDMRYDDSEEQIQRDVRTIADKVKSMIAAGTAPGDITVSGYSLGSVTALFAAIAIADPGVNYVLLAGCPGANARSFDIDYAKVQGRVLSIIDSNDDRFGSCGSRISNAATFKEITIDSGLGHRVFRLPDSSTIDLWKKPMVNWAMGL